MPSRAASEPRRPELLTTHTRRVLFAPLDAHGRAETVAERLRTAISLGVLAEGDVLPPEPELAAQFNISPVTLREALNRLRDQGLVTTRRGRGGGTVVTAPTVSQIRVAMDQVRALTALDLRDLADWRRALSLESVRLAARRASSEDVAPMPRSVERLHEAGDGIEGRRAESRFFIELGAASQSTRLSTALINAQVEYSPVLTLVYHSVDTREHVARLLEPVSEHLREVRVREAEEAVTEAIGFVAARAGTLRSNGWHA
jgi:DNA-binding FadR family transcriptional regulator